MMKLLRALCGTFFRNSTLIDLVPRGQQSLGNYEIPPRRPLPSFNHHNLAQLEKVFLPLGTGFLRRNFPNIEEEFS